MDEPRRRFSLELPEGWRALTPDEGRSLIGREGIAIPAQLLRPAPPWSYVFGDVERWLDGHYDGRSLTVTQQDGEPEMGAAGLRTIREHWEGESDSHERLDIRKLALTELGPDRHPAIECAIAAVLPGGEAHRRWQLYVPTRGQLLIFDARWREGDEGAVAVFRAMADSMKFAYGPRGPASVGTKLLYAALIGLAVGLLLHLMKKRISG